MDIERHVVSDEVQSEGDDVSRSEIIEIDDDVEEGEIERGRKEEDKQLGYGHATAWPNVDYWRKEIHTE